MERAQFRWIFRSASQRKITGKNVDSDGDDGADDNNHDDVYGNICVRQMAFRCVVRAHTSTDDDYMIGKMRRIMWILCDEDE